MNRPKKFRVWDGKLMSIFSIEIEAGGYLTKPPVPPKHFNPEGGGFKELMESTNLFDKNGKEIYEGDIIRIGKDLIEEVRWINVGDWFGEKQPMVGYVSHGTIYKGSPIEVIGNIYENPELLNS